MAGQDTDRARGAAAELNPGAECATCGGTGRVTEGVGGG
jgi:hypothetical protein